MIGAHSYLPDEYYLNHCTKHLARTRGSISDAWRFPIIDTQAMEGDSSRANAVSFVFEATGRRDNVTVGVIGTFHRLYIAIPLRRVHFNGNPTAYFAVTVTVPQGEVHTYRFRVGDEIVNDPINPQTATLDNGQVWSRFFTDRYLRPINFEDWELRVLQRLMDEILPFRTKASENFLDRYYQGLDDQARRSQARTYHRLNESVGEVSYVDNLLAREERQRLDDYKTCIRIISNILRSRIPAAEPDRVSSKDYAILYDEMASGVVPGWDYGAYGDPGYFLGLLRRHSVTGAFSHPRYGGNVGAAGWAFLEERFRDAKTGRTLFDWRVALEPPLGTNTDYTG